MFASLNTTRLEKQPPGSRTSEACNPFNAPADWLVMAEDFISKCWLLPIQLLSAPTPARALITANQLRQPGVADRTRQASDRRQRNPFSEIGVHFSTFGSENNAAPH